MRPWLTWAALGGSVYVAVLIGFAVHSAGAVTGTATVDRVAAAEYRVSANVITACQLLDNDPADTATAIDAYDKAVSTSQPIRARIDAQAVMIHALRAQADEIADAIGRIALPAAPDTSRVGHVNDPSKTMPDVGLAAVVMNVHDQMAGFAESSRIVANDFEAGVRGDNWGGLDMHWSSYYETRNAAHTLCHEFFHR